MVRASLRKAVVAVALALFPGQLPAQGPVPALPPLGGGVPDRLTPQDLEAVNRRRDLEGILSQLRELYARGEYSEMMRLIQDAERSYPNDFKLRNYGYLAQQALDRSQIGTAEPVVSPDSPALRGSPVPAAAPPPLSDTGLPSLPTNVSAPEPAASLPQPTASATPASTPRPNPANARPAATSTAVSPEVEYEETRKKYRKILFGVGGALLVVAIIALLRRRKAAAEADGVARRAARISAESARGTGMALPPPVPTGATVAPSSGNSLRDAMTEVDVNEEEVARGIAASIGTRPASALSTPTFDALFGAPGTQDQPTGFHDNIPTMVDTLVEDDGDNAPAPEPAAPAAPPAPFSPSFFAPEPAAPSGGGVSFDDLGIVLFSDPPPAAAPAPAPPNTAPATPALTAPPAAAKEDDPFAAFNFGGIGALSEDEKPAAPAKPASEPSAPPKPNAQDGFPGLPAGDEPIRLNDLNFLAPGAETVASPFPSAPTPAPAMAKKEADDPLSATVDLSEVLFGKFEPGASEEKTTVQGAGTRPSPFDETVATPVVTPASTPDAPISLESLGLSRPESRPEPLSLTLPELDNQETVQIPPASSSPSSSWAQTQNGTDETLSATIRLDEATIGVGEPSAPQSAPAAADTVGTLSFASDTRPEEQSYYASSSQPDTSLDERSERMFHEQCDRAQKAITESNWKQAVHYLSIAAAIRPDDSEVMQKLKHAREQKRRQEAGV